MAIVSEQVLRQNALFNGLNLDDRVRADLPLRYAARNEMESPIALAIVRLLLLPGFWLSDEQDLERVRVSAEHSYVGLPDTKGDGQVRATGPSAVKVTTEQPNSSYIFQSEASDRHITTAKPCLERLCFSVGLDSVTPPTLSHMFASVVGDLGFSDLTIRALLGHGSQSVTQDYPPNRRSAEAGRGPDERRDRIAAGRQKAASGHGAPRQATSSGSVTVSANRPSQASDGC